MDIQRSQQLRDIIELSTEMLKLAHEQEWSQVAELEEKRRLLVMACFRQPTPEQDAPEVAAAIREILVLNQEVTALGKECQQQLGSEMHTNRVGRAAQTAYLNCSR